MATLQWKKPNETGGEEFWYTLRRSNQTDIQTFQTFKERLYSDAAEVEYKVTDLVPSTTYVLRVIVNNNATSIVSVNEHLRRCDVLITTGEGGMLHHTLCACNGKSLEVI